MVNLAHVRSAVLTVKSESNLLSITATLIAATLSAAALGAEVPTTVLSPQAL